MEYQATWPVTKVNSPLIDSIPSTLFFLYSISFTLKLRDHLEAPQTRLTSEFRQMDDGCDLLRVS